MSALEERAWGKAAGAGGGSRYGLVVRVNRYGAGERAGCAASVHGCSPAVGCRQAAGAARVISRERAGGEAV